MPRTLHLVPEPKAIRFLPGSFPLAPDMFILLPAHPAGPDFFAAERFAIEAEPLTATRFHIAAGHGADARFEIRTTLDDTLGAKVPDAVRDQSYRLIISGQGIQLTARAPAGIFYAFQTLLQIIRECSFAQGTHVESNRKSKIKNRKSPSLPCLDIFDHPAFARRGVYHDTARGKVPTLDTLLQLIDDLAHLKYNEFQLYIENNFQFRKFPEMYDDTDPFTAEELLLLDEACRARHMDFVPSLTSLGHFEKILNRPKFRPLAEAEPEQLKAIGAPCWHDAAPWSLCVTDPGAKKLLAGMYAEFAPIFSSPQFNICCDEAYDLGRVRSKKLADKIGTGQMYVDWINNCDGLVKSHGSEKSIQMWGDIILNHPELIPQLPPDATLLEWGYEHDHKFDEHCATFSSRLGLKAKGKHATSKSSSRSFYVAPGTSSWLTLSSRTKNAFGNIHSAAAAGLKYGARGILVTDWGDHGHQQMLAVSLLPFAYGAAAGWNLAATPNPCATGRKEAGIEDMLGAISLHLFEDPSRQYASIAYDLGLTYERLGWQRFNASLDHFLFREKWDFANYVNRAPEKALKETIRATQTIAVRLHQSQSLRSDRNLLTYEFFLTAQQIIHTCERTLLRKQWLAADPKKRNPEEPSLRDLPAKPLPGNFSKEMTRLGKDIVRCESIFKDLWLARNKPSRLADVTAEFRRLAAEYRQFAR